MEQIKNIMFICTGNTCRSAMAEGMMKKMLEDKGIRDVNVCSAGLRASTGEYSTDEAIMVMKEDYDVNLLNHQSINVKNTDVKDMDLILCATHAHLTTLEYMYPELAHRIFTIKEYAYGSSISLSCTSGPYAYSFIVNIL